MGRLLNNRPGDARPACGNAGHRTTRPWGFIGTPAKHFRPQVNRLAPAGNAAFAKGSQQACVCAPPILDDVLREQAAGAGVCELIFKTTEVEEFCAGRVGTAAELTSFFALFAAFAHP